MVMESYQAIFLLMNEDPVLRKKNVLLSQKKNVLILQKQNVLVLQKHNTLVLQNHNTNSWLRKTIRT